MRAFYLEYKLLEFFMVALELCMKNLMSDEMLVLAMEDLTAKFDHTHAYQKCIMEEAMKLEGSMGDFLKSLVQVQ